MWSRRSDATGFPKPWPHSSPTQKGRWVPNKLHRFFKMRPATDLLGKTFGAWTVISRAASIGKNAGWNCRCACGTERHISASGLVQGHRVGCGCQYTPKSNARPRLPYDARRSTRSIWLGMVARCHHPTAKDFHRYGARGIFVCDEWRNDFGAFQRDMGLRPSPAYSIDRIDNNGPYVKSNCRWATRVEQARNCSHNHPVQRSDGQRFRTMVEAAESIGLPYDSFRAAVRRGRACGGFSWVNVQ